jgi:uncharacterized protein
MTPRATCASRVRPRAPACLPSGAGAVDASEPPGSPLDPRPASPPFPGRADRIACGASSLAPESYPRPVSATAVTAASIVDAVAAECSVERSAVEAVFQQLDQGLSPVYIARFQRSAHGALQEGLVRRLMRVRAQYEELDRRRATVLKTLEKEGVPEKTLERARTTTDRFELEDLFLPFRKPEPEVQMAMDRGLGGLADEFTQRAAGAKSEEGAATAEGAVSDEHAADAQVAEAPAAEVQAAEASTGEASTGEASAEAAPAGSSEDAAAAVESSPVESEAPAADAPVAEIAAEESAAPSPEQSPEPSAEPSAEGAAAAEDSATAGAADEGQAEGIAAGESANAEAEGSVEEQQGAEPSAAGPDVEGNADRAAGGKPSGKSKGGAKDDSPKVSASREELQVELTPELARACAAYVKPDRDVHNESAALEGAMRILSDRLGRSPELRGQVRRLLLRHGLLKTRPGSNTDRQGRYKALTKLEVPLKQLQGQRLIQLRQGQRDRALSTGIVVDEGRVLPKLRAALGRGNAPAYDSLLETVSRRALYRRLLPMLEEDVRLLLKERADDEALRFISSHLRQILMTPCLGPRAAAGLDVDARGNWTVSAVDFRGDTIGTGVQIEVADKNAFDLAEALGAYLGDTEVQWIAVGSGKAGRKALAQLRPALAEMGGEGFATVVNDAGLSAYANGELGRTELPEHSVQQRMAVSLARRLQDPMLELLKVDTKHLSLGFEQSLVSKANLKRVLSDTIESCVAQVGMEWSRATALQLEHLPGIDAELAGKLLAAWNSGEITSRQALQASGLLTEPQYRSVVASLRFSHSDERLDRSGLHPEQYELARRIIEATGRPESEVIGQRGGTKGLKRGDFDLDEATWRDLTRELSHPGRDPRPRLRKPTLLAPDTDPSTLAKDQVVEGVVVSVSNFGAFVDLGLEREGLIHISEITRRYVRDARELISLGQVVRARITDPSAPRIGLSLKDVPEPEREERGPGGEEGRGPRRGRREQRQGGFQKPQRLARVAGGRRDGMPGDDERGGRGGRGGGGGRKGGGFGGGGRRDGRGRGRRDDDGYVSPKELREVSDKGAPANNPFAKFFKDKPEGEE